MPTPNALSRLNSQVVGETLLGSNSRLRKAVGAPLFRADTIVDEEQPVGIVLSFDFSQARIVAAPVRLLKSALQVIALTYIRSPVRHDGAELFHALMNLRGCFSPLHNRGLMPGNARISGSLAVGHGYQRERSKHGWIHCGVLRPGNRVRWRSAESLIEVQRDA